MSMTVTNNDLGNVIRANALYTDDVLTFAGAGTVAEGTILARDTSTLKLVPFVKGGTTAGNGIPNSVMTYDVVASGAGDVAVRPAIEGSFIKSRLVIAADGDDQNVDKAVLDQLRDMGLVAINEQDLSVLDNQ